MTHMCPSEFGNAYSLKIFCITSTASITIINASTMIVAISVAIASIACG